MNKLAAVSTSNKLTFSAILPVHLPEIWATVSDLLRPAVDRSDGRWTIQALFHALYTGGQELWVGYDENKIVLALTTQRVTYPNCSMLAIQFLGGSGYDEWNDDLLAMIETHAKKVGCDGIEAVARFGFWPMFKRHQYVRSHVTYEKIFSEE